MIITTSSSIIQLDLRRSQPPSLLSWIYYGHNLENCSLARQLDMTGEEQVWVKHQAIPAVTMAWKIVQPAAASERNKILYERSMLAVITEHEDNARREVSQYTSYFTHQRHHNTLSLRLAEVSFSRKMFAVNTLSSPGQVCAETDGVFLSVLFNNSKVTTRHWSILWSWPDDKHHLTRCLRSKFKKITGLVKLRQWITNWV